MSNMTKVAKELKKAMADSDARKPKAYDTEATVVRSEGNTLWVKFPGGETETPVRKTIDAKPGDVVMVRVANHRAWTNGNSTNPPTDDTRANQIGAAAQPSMDFVAALADKDVTVKSITAATGYIDDLYSKNITTENLRATTGYIKDLTSENITAENIVADHIDVGDLKANKADIDLANVEVAWIEQGNIKKAEVFDENVFDLSGNRATISRIDASKINVANLRADNLVVRRINGQPVVGGYTLIDSNSPGYESKNPQELGWYEFVNAQWVLSTDTTVDMTKAYYQEGNEVSLYDQQYIDGLENDLQHQIDGAVQTYTGSVVPTLVNWPYTEWYDTSVTPIHDERAKHVGDIYYVVNSSSAEGGYCYRFAYDNTEHAYSWVLIKDSDVTKALSDISELQTFESETTSWIDETDEGLETIRTNHTALSGRVDDVEATANAALPATTFETFESTTFTDLVDEVDEQSTTMTNMTTRLGLNADGTQSATDIVSKESALEQTVTGISTRVGKTEMHLAGMYATSSTAVGTAEKVATIVPTLANYELANGAMVTVKFTAENTTASPTLNLNDTGAKPIKTYSGGNLTEDEYKWKAGSTFTFTYNGTNWLMQDSTASVRMSTNETQINQTADSIESLASGNTTYTKPDGTTATSAIGTTVTQTANNVLIKATRTGATDAEKTAGGTSAVGLINVTPDTVKIKAEHVEIDGSAIFNAISEDVDDAIGDAVDEIEVGGRNLQEKSNDGTQYSWAQNGGAFTKTVNNEGATFAITTLPASGSWGVFQITGALRDKIKAGETYTLSYDLMTTNSISDIIASFNIRKGNGSLSIMDEGSEQYVTFSTTANTWKHIEHTNTAKATLPAMDNQWIYISLPRLKDQLGSFSIKNVKVEKGNKATDWTPAPEDVQAEIDAKKSTHTLTASNTGGTTYATILGWAQEGTSVTFGVTSTAGVKIGDTVRIAYKAVDMGTGGTIVYILGTVTSVNNATSLDVISHGLDTTVIDGGHILTGTIDASKVNVSNLTVGSFGSTEQNKILNDKIQLGGRNLLVELGNTLTYASYGNHTFINTETDGKTAFAPQLQVYDGSTYVGQLFQNGNISETGYKIFTFKALMAVPSGRKIRFKHNGSNKDISVFYNFTSDIKKDEELTLSFTVDGYNPSSVGGLIVKNIKLEKGNKATDWTLSPEDSQGDENYILDSDRALTTLGGSLWFTTSKEIPARSMFTLSVDINASNIVWDTTSSHQRIGMETSNPNGSGGTQYMGCWAYKSGTGSSAAVITGNSFNQRISLTHTNLTTIAAGHGVGIFIQGISSGTVSISRPQLEIGRVATPWKKAPNDTYYITKLDETGIRITPYDSSGNDYLQINSSAIDFVRNGASMVSMNDDTLRMGKSAGKHSVLNGSGMTIYTGAESTASNNVAFFGATSRIGNASGRRVEIASSSVDIYSADNQKRLAVDSGTGVVVGRSDKGHTLINDDGLNVYDVNNKRRTSITRYGLNVYDTDGSTNVASFGASARIGKEASTNIQVSNSAISFYNNKNEYVSLTPNTTQDVGGCRLQTYYYHSGTKVNSYGFTLDGNGMRVRMGTDNVNYHNFTSSGYSSRVPIYIYDNGLYLSTNNTAIYCKDTASANMDVLRVDSGNALVLGYGHYTKNASGYNAWLEGYNVYLRARQKCYANGSQITTSDKRLKKDIIPISDKFKSLFMDLQPVEYRMEQSEDKDIHLGLTAQDVEMAFMKNNISVDKYAIVDEYSYPEESTRYKALAYTEFIPLCIKMIQSQQEEINTLKGEVNALRSN